jgi:multidrug efflux pump subunit AcrB
MASTFQGSRVGGAVKFKAVVLYVLLALAGLATLVIAGLFFFLLPWLGGLLAKPRPGVTIEAMYPGANAQVVADTVAVPLEQQVIGVENMVSLQSRCTDDGRCTIHVTFERGTDLEMAQVLVQNRVSLALPTLPDAVKAGDISVKKQSPGVLLLVSVSSPDGSRDSLYLSNYATQILRDELARLPGVYDITCFGPQDYSLRIWVDPDKLAARNLTAADVVQALREQNMQVAAEPVGEQPMGRLRRLQVREPRQVAAEPVGEQPMGQGQNRAIPLKTLGRLPDLEQFDGLIVKTTADGLVVRLRDVARIEVGADQPESHASLNGQPVVLLALFPAPQVRPRELSRALGDKLAQLRLNQPEGVQVDVAFDFTPNLEAPEQRATPDYLLLDVTLPAGASVERTSAVLERCAALLRGMQGVQDVLALTDHPFDRASNQACLLVRLAPADRRQANREQLTQTIRTRLGDEVAEMALRVRDLSGRGRFPRCGYPIEFALVGPEQDRLMAWAEKLADRLAQNPKLTDVGTSPGATRQPQLSLDVDRAQAKALGVSLDDLFTVLQVHLGSLYVNDFNGFGRTWQVRVQAGPRFRNQAEDLKQLKVRNTQGDMVPVAQFVSVREIEAAGVLERLDGKPMVAITANPAPGESLAAARSLCESLAEEIRKELQLSAEYRLTWRQE